MHGNLNSQDSTKQIEKQDSLKASPPPHPLGQDCEHSPELCVQVPSESQSDNPSLSLTHSSLTTSSLDSDRTSLSIRFPHPQGHFPILCSCSEKQRVD